MLTVTEIAMLKGREDFMKAIFEKRLRTAQGIAFSVLGDARKAGFALDHFLMRIK